MSKKLMLHFLLAIEVLLSLVALVITAVWLFTGNADREPLAALLAGLAAFLAYFVHPALDRVTKQSQIVSALCLEVLKNQLSLALICDSRTSVVLVRLETTTSEYLMSSGTLWVWDLDLCSAVGNWLSIASGVNQFISVPITDDRRAQMASLLRMAAHHLKELRSTIEKRYPRNCHFPKDMPDFEQKLLAFDSPTSTPLPPTSPATE